MRYFRSTRMTVHREGCSTQPVEPLWWTWADGKTLREISRESAAHGIQHKFCRHCCWDAA